MAKRGATWLDQSFCRYYGGEVSAYDHDRGLHRVQYDDADQEWVDLVKERHRIVKAPPLPPSLPSISATGKPFS
jgi:hypothetical protein